MLGANNRKFKCLIGGPELTITRTTTGSIENKECDAFSPLACTETDQDSLIRSLNSQEEHPSSVHSEDHKDILPSKIQRMTLKKQIKIKKSKSILHQKVRGPDWGLE